MADLTSEAFTEALRPPAVSIGGKQYEARVLSLHEFAPFVPWFEKMQAGEITDVRTVAGVIQTYLEALYPRKWWQFWKPNVVKLLCALPWNELQEIIQGFFARQAATMTPRSPTNGKPSRG